MWCRSDPLSCTLTPLSVRTDENDVCGEKKMPERVPPVPLMLLPPPPPPPRPARVEAEPMRGFSSWGMDTTVSAAAICTAQRRSEPHADQKRGASVQAETVRGRTQAGRAGQPSTDNARPQRGSGSD